jgi:hypothetical protein
MPNAAPRRRRAARTETARLRAAARLLASGADLRDAARRGGMGPSRLARKVAYDRRLRAALERLRVEARGTAPQPCRRTTTSRPGRK